MGVWGTLSHHFFCQCEDCLGKNLLLNTCSCCIMLCPLLLRNVINSILNIIKENREAFRCILNTLCEPPTHPHPISFYCELEFDIVLHRYRKQIQSVCVCGGGDCVLRCNVGYIVTKCGELYPFHKSMGL